VEVGRRGRKGGAQEVFDTRLELGGENGGEHERKSWLAERGDT
jgi:hypothetical protein